VENSGRLQRLRGVTGMSRKKKRQYSPKPFEALGHQFVGIHGGRQPDTFAQVYESMLQSDAFKDLNSTQKVLYFICKAQYYGKRKPSRDYPDIEELQGDDLFYFNWNLAQEYGLYKPTCNKNFQMDMKALIDHGLIDLVASGIAHRKKNIYRFSDKWKSWKKDS
jgi:hypothetical protein